MNENNKTDGNGEEIKNVYKFHKTQNSLILAATNEHGHNTASGFLSIWMCSKDLIELRPF